MNADNTTETYQEKLERTLNYARTHVRHPEAYKPKVEYTDYEVSDRTEESIKSEAQYRIYELREYNRFLKDMSELISPAKAAELDGISTRIDGSPSESLADILARALSNPDLDAKTRSSIEELIRNNSES